MIQYINQCRLNISYIPVFGIGTSFVDSVNIDARLERLPDSFLQQTKTEKFYKTVANQQTSKQILVQSVKRERYRLFFYCYESTDWQKINVADSIEIINNYGESISVEVQEVSFEDLGSGAYKCTLTFIDLTSDTDSIVNHCESSAIEGAVNARLRIYGLPFGEGLDRYDFYTKVLPERLTGVDNVETIEVAGTKIDTNITNWNGFKVKFWLDSLSVLPDYGLTAAQLFDTYVQYCVFDTMPNLSFGSNSHNAVERIEVKPTETQANLIGLVEREIIFKTSINNLTQFDVPN